MGAIDRVFRSRRPSQERPLAAIIAGLWLNGEQGVRFEASDLSTMFQDAAGTLPVYAPGQGQVDPPVGLWLDKRLPIGSELVQNGDNESSVAVAPEDVLIRLSKTRTADFAQSGAFSTKLTSTAGSGAHYWQLWKVPANKSVLVTGFIYIPAGAAAGQPIRIVDQSDGSVIVEVAPAASTDRWVSFRYYRAPKGTQWLLSIGNNTPADWGTTSIYVDNLSIRELPGNHAYQTTTTSRPTLSARYNQLTGTESLATQSVTVVATAYTLTTAGPGSVTLSGAASGTYTAGSRMVTCTAGALTLTVLGSVTQADLRPANDGVGLPPYQRVVDPNTYDTVFFPPYLRFDGVDDWLQTANVDFSGVSAVLVMAAVRQLSDASRGIIVELGASGYGQPGSFNIEQAWFSPNWSSSYSGATGSSTVTEPGIAAPASAVVGSYADQGAPSIQLRYQGRARAPSTAAVGGGGFLNAPVYIGRRGGSSLAANMRLYGLLVRGGPAADNQVAAVGKRLNQQARIY